MSTVEDSLINPALMDIGALAQGETAATSESDQALIALNQILSSWSLERRFVHTHKQENFTLSVGVSAYTMGSGGTWSTSARPVGVTGIMATSGAFQQGLDVMPMADFRASIRNGQGVTAVLPSKAGVDTAGTLVNIEVWPPPSTTATVRVSSWQPLTEFAAITDTVSFPVPGYQAALRAELAITLAPSFGRPIPPGLVERFTVTQNRLREANITETPKPLATPAAPPQQ